MEGGVYLVPFTIVDLRLLCGVADFLKKGGFACIRSPHNENSKAPKPVSNFLSRKWHIV